MSVDQDLVESPLASHSVYYVQDLTTGNDTGLAISAFETLTRPQQYMLILSYFQKKVLDQTHKYKIYSVLEGDKQYILEYCNICKAQALLSTYSMSTDMPDHHSDDTSKTWTSRAWIY